MTAIFKIPLKPKAGLLFATVAMSLLCVLGIDLVTGSFHGLLLGVDNKTNSQGIWLFYAARMAGQFPGLWVAAVIIGYSDFRHPVLLAGFLALSVKVVLTGLNLAFHDYPFLTVPGLGLSVPILADVVTTVGHVTVAMFFTWLATGPLRKYLWPANTVAI